MSIPPDSNNTSPDNTIANGLPFDTFEANAWGNTFSMNSNRRVQFEDDNESDIGFGMRSPTNSPRLSNATPNVPIQQPIWYLSQPTAGPSNPTSLVRPFGLFNQSAFIPSEGQTSFAAVPPQFYRYGNQNSAPNFSRFNTTQPITQPS